MTDQPKGVAARRGFSARGLTEWALRVAAVPAAGALLGLGAIVLAERGAGHRPVMSALILATAVAAGLAPLRFGLPIAVVLAGFEGFMDDFAGGAALYWNEIFIALLLARSLVARPPRRVEVAAATAIALIYVGYLAAGTKPIAIFWAAKVLLTSVLAGWALARMRRLGQREWVGTYYGFAVAVSANFILAYWQKHEGKSGLLDLGLGKRIKEGPGGVLRAFGGFTSHAPFSYLLGVTFLIWAAFLFGSARERSIALLGLWLPLICAVGIAWSYDGTSAVALGAIGASVLAVRAGFTRSLARAGAGIGVTALVVAVAFIVSAPLRSLVRWSGDFKSTSERVRLMGWREYVRELSILGAGPATSGSAYERVAPGARRIPVRFLAGWDPPEFTEGGVPFRWMGTRATLVTRRGSVERPRLTLVAYAVGNRRPRVLTVRYGHRLIDRLRIPADSLRALEGVIPAGGGQALLKLTARPASPPPTVKVLDIHFKEVPFRPPLTPAERIFRRVFLRDGVSTKLGGAAPGVVDNLYLSWLFQYGLLLGALLCAVWLFSLGWFIVRRCSFALPLAAALLAGFLLVAAFFVNVWEESPTDFLAALVLGQAFAAGARLVRPRRGQKGMRPRSQKSFSSVSQRP